MRNYREARTEDEKSDSRLTGPEASRCWECALKTNRRFEGKGAFLLAFLFREACPGAAHIACFLGLHAIRIFDAPLSDSRISIPASMKRVMMSALVR